MERLLCFLRLLYFVRAQKTTNFGFLQVNFWLLLGYYSKKGLVFQDLLRILAVFYVFHLSIFLARIIF